MECCNCSLYHSSLYPPAGWFSPTPPSTSPLPAADAGGCSVAAGAAAAAAAAGAGAGGGDQQLSVRPDGRVSALTSVVRRAVNCV